MACLPRALCSIVFTGIWLLQVEQWLLALSVLTSCFVFCCLHRHLIAPPHNGVLTSRFVFYRLLRDLSTPGRAMAPGTVCATSCFVLYRLHMHLTAPPHNGVLTSRFVVCRLHRHLTAPPGTGVLTLCFVVCRLHRYLTALPRTGVLTLCFVVCRLHMYLTAPGIAALPHTRRPDRAVLTATPVLPSGDPTSSSMLQH